eukprot:s1134_g3.t1
MDALQAIYQHVSKTSLPLWATCQGFQALCVLASQDPSVVVPTYGTLGTAVSLHFTPNAYESRLLKDAPETVFMELGRRNSTLNFHSYGVLTESFQHVQGFQVLATDVDSHGQVFASLMEHQRLPIFAAQFHPELYYFLDPHSGAAEPAVHRAIEANSYFMQYFVKVSNSFACTGIALSLLYTLNLGDIIIEVGLAFLLPGALVFLGLGPALTALRLVFFFILLDISIEADQSYASGWRDQQTWDYGGWGPQQGNQSARGKSPRSRQRPRSAKKTRGQDQWHDQAGYGGYPQMQGKASGKGGQSQMPPPPPAQPPWNSAVMMGPSVQAAPPMMQPMSSPPQMMMGVSGAKGGMMMPPPGPPMMMPGSSATTQCSMTGQPLQMSMAPMPAMPPPPPEPDAQFWDYLRQRKPDLPPDIQQEITKREGVRATTDLLSAVQQMSDAREAYEQAPHGRSQHLQAWKVFLAKAVTDWQAFAQQFVQHEQSLQERIACTKEVFMKAKETVDLARKEAGEVVVDLTDEEEPLTGAAAGGTSVERVTASIQELTSSLQKLHSDAAALEAEAPPVAKRPRVEVKEDTEMGTPAKPSASSPFGKAGQ